MVLNSKIQSYGGLPALLFLSRISASAMVGRKLSQSMIFSRSRQSPSSLNFSNLFSSANREIYAWTTLPCSASIISYFVGYCNRWGIFRGSQNVLRQTLCPLRRLKEQPFPSGNVQLHKAYLFWYIFLKSYKFPISRAAYAHIANFPAESGLVLSDTNFAIPLLKSLSSDVTSVYKTRAMATLRSISSSIGQ